MLSMLCLFLVIELTYSTISNLLIPSCTASWMVGNFFSRISCRPTTISPNIIYPQPYLTPQEGPICVYTQLLVVDTLNPVDKSLTKVSRRIKLRFEKCVVVSMLQRVNVFKTCVHARPCYQMSLIMFPNTFQIELHLVWTYDAPTIYLILFARSYTLLAMHRPNEKPEKQLKPCVKIGQSRSPIKGWKMELWCTHKWMTSESHMPLISPITKGHTHT